ncbi:MAG: hypothetical protein NCW75_05865 [Phycisphaera sp.]|nr:MAG: hypothetical protein NCW75_05865 [Phycisphaera sp.]
MLKAITLVSLATATAAGAQTASLNFDVIDPGPLSPGDSTMVFLSAGFDPADYAIAGVLTDVLASAPRDLTGAWSDMALIAPMDGPGTAAGAPSGMGGVSGIIAGQLNFPPAGIYADSTNPIAFWSATFTAPADQPGGYVVDLSTSTSRFDVYTDRRSSLSESRLDGLVEGRGQIWVIPAPASALVLLGGLGAALCRRR